MKTYLKAITSGLVMGAALMIGPAAIAHDESIYGGYGFRGDVIGGDRWGQRAGYLVQSTCSGERGLQVQRRLNREIRFGNLDRWNARRIQNDIDRLRFQEARECRQGDFRSARRIGREYSRIDARIDSVSGHLDRGWHH
ncbi:hypothetical protein [Novosphingobium sp. Chol11]|uniref:hypothetical protein n=1 Tax=Novosphingobium sp. Chol11 TaxID=1385763 RepID=UPI0025E11F80|nr:hypothetical protein [Novosphingobium sp. Chol11]